MIADPPNLFEKRSHAATASSRDAVQVLLGHELALAGCTPS